MKNKVAYMGLFLSLALICGYVESLIPFYFGVPGVKLGLTNVVIVTVSRWGVACESQGTGTLTFSASILPSVTVTAHVSIINSL